MKQKNLRFVPNYRVQLPRLAHIVREEPCCAACAHVSFFTRACHCNLIRGRNKNSELSIESKVHFNAICDKYKDGKAIIHARAVYSGLRGIREEREEVEQPQVQAEHDGDSEQQPEVHSARPDERHAAARLGEANSIRVPLVKENKTITIAIPR